MGSMYSVVRVVTVETVAKGPQTLLDKRCKVFSGVYAHNELANLVSPRSHAY